MIALVSGVLLIVLFGVAYERETSAAQPRQPEWMMEGCFDLGCVTSLLNKLLSVHVVGTSGDEGLGR